MRIRGSDLRKIIKEELRRSMLNEGNTKTFKTAIVRTGDITPGSSFSGDLLFNKEGLPEKFVTKSGSSMMFGLGNYMDQDNAGKTVAATIYFIDDKGAVTITYSV